MVVRSDSWNRYNGVKILTFCNDPCLYNHPRIWEISNCMWFIKFREEFWTWEHLNHLKKHPDKVLAQFKFKRQGLPSWSSGKEFALQGRRCGFDPWSRNQDLTCHGATKPVCHNYWAGAPQRESLRTANYRAHVPWSLRATTWEEKTRTPQLERNLCTTTKSPHASMKDPACHN